jgi:hypothetical protein
MGNTSAIETLIQEKYQGRKYIVTNTLHITAKIRNDPGAFVELYGPELEKIKSKKLKNAYLRDISRSVIHSYRGLRGTSTYMVTLLDVSRMNKLEFGFKWKEMSSQNRNVSIVYGDKDSMVISSEFG